MDSPQRCASRGIQLSNENHPDHGRRNGTVGEISLNPRLPAQATTHVLAILPRRSMVRWLCLLGSHRSNSRVATKGPCTFHHCCFLLPIF